MNKPWSEVESVARFVLLVLGGVLVVTGLKRSDLSGMAAILPRIERIRLFGKHGLDARLRRSERRGDSDR
jgi:hypothetical protein